MVSLRREERSGPRSAKERRAQSRSNPLEKNLPSPAMTRAEQGLDWAAQSDLIWARAERMEAKRAGLRRCSVAPVKVRRYTGPRFSTVHIVVVVVAALSD